MITVREVTGSRKGMKDFINFQYRLYKNEQNWCPPLRIERKRFFSPKNPYMHHSRVAYFVAYAGERPVGRVTAQIDGIYNRFHKSRQGFFGFFESIREREAAEKLMERAEAWVKSNGMNSIAGPLNFSTNHEIGFLTRGFERPNVTLMPYTKAYYPEFFHGLGYREEKRLLAYWMTGVREIPKILIRHAREVERRMGTSVRVRNLNMRKLGRDVRIAFDIYNEAWSRNWGFVPVRDEEVSEFALGLRLIGNSRIMFIAHMDGEPAGILIAIPDINETLIKVAGGRLSPQGVFRLLAGMKREKTVRVIIIGVKSGYRRLGLGLYLYYHLFRALVTSTSFENVETSWVLEDNSGMSRIQQLLGADPYKKYVIFRKDLEA